LRVGLALGGFHYLADEKLEDAFVAGFEFGDIVGVFLDDFAGGFFDGAGVDLGAEAFRGDDFGGGASVSNIVAKTFLPTAPVIFRSPQHD
jgi:hypothetical protein